MSDEVFTDQERETKAIKGVVEFFVRQGWTPDMIHVLLGPVEVPEPVVSVRFEDGHAVIESRVARMVSVTGDVRDGFLSLRPGKPVRRKLTKEGNGWVEVDGQRFSVKVEAV